MAHDALQDLQRSRPARTLQPHRVIGVGGWGVVYQATLKTAQGFRREVAVKVARPDAADPGLAEQMIRNEAALGGGLRHPCLVTTLDLIRLDGRLAVVQELVDGQSLSRLVGHAYVESRPGVRALVGVGRRVAEALRHLEAGGNAGTPVIHRDVKPGNIVLGWDGSVRLLDLGVAARAGTSGFGPVVAGSPRFMAPEQRHGLAIPGRTDTYGLACTLVACIAGQVAATPDGGESEHRRHVERLVGSLHGRLSGPARLQLVPLLSAMLRYHPARRPGLASVVSALCCIERSVVGPGLSRWLRNRMPSLPVRDRHDPLDLVGRVPRVSEAQAEETVLVPAPFALAC